MIITGLNITKKGRVSVYVDGEFVFAVEKECLIKSQLKKDQQVSKEQLQDLLQSSSKRIAINKALNVLSFKNYTAKQLTIKLNEDFDEEIVHQVVEHMQEIGLINDLDYATRYANDLYNLKFYPPYAIRYELRQKGIDDDTIQEVIEEFDPEDNIYLAAKLIAKKYPNIDDEKVKKRAFAALRRIGYRYDEIYSAINMQDDD